MKIMNHSLLRAISSILIGLLLVVWPETAIVYLVIAIGVLFFIPGLISVISYVTKGQKIGMPFPIVSIGSLLFGLWLMVSPAFFVGILMYVLGIILVFAGISQIINLVNIRNWAQVGIGYFVVPILILLAGMIVLLNPFAVASIPFIILGISCMVYGISDIFNRIVFRQKKEEQPITKEVEIVDVMPIEEMTDVNK